MARVSRELRGAATNLTLNSLLDELGVLTSGMTKFNRRAENLLRDRSQHDALTGLPGHSIFRERARAALDAASRSGSCAGILHIDLDRFKAFNEILGYEAGDCLLEQVARRLEEILGPLTTLARVASDEFVAVVGGASGPAEIEQMAQDLLGSFHAPFTVEGRELFPRASIGFSLFPQDATDPRELEKQAEAALRAVKRMGRCAARRFRADEDSFSSERFDLEIGLNRALSDRQLFLCYQSQFDLRSGVLVGREALLRWKHPQLGLIPAAKFVPVAEESGLIVPIGAWVLEEACRQNQIWISRGLGSVKIAVNVSVVQFDRADFVDMVTEVLERTNLAPNLLELELTESMVMRETSTSMPKIARLRALGIRLAMDDFGTGYSSLSHLGRMPLDLLKIDRCFVEDLKDNRRAEPLIQAIITLAHKLGMRVIAEGVETEFQLGMLGRLECDEAQGYLLGMPLPASSVEGSSPPAHLHANDLCRLLQAVSEPAAAHVEVAAPAITA